MGALAVKLRDGKRLAEVKITERKIDDAVRKLKALKENKAKPAEAHKAVELAVGAAQHLETEEELRKRKEQEKAEAERGIREFIAGAISHLNKAEGTEAKLLLERAETLSKEHAITVQHVDLVKLITEIKAAERYKRAPGSAEWDRVCGEVKERLKVSRVE